MLFNLKPDTECELTSFVGRVQKSGPDDVPAVTFRLLLKSVPNSLLDMFSPTIRQTAYEPVPGQDQLPGVDVTTPILRSKDLKHWAPETRLEGWAVVIARGTVEAGAAPADAYADGSWPFPKNATTDKPPQSVTVETSRPGTRTARGRDKTKAALAAGSAS